MAILGIVMRAWSLDARRCGGTGARLSVRGCAALILALLLFLAGMPARAQTREYRVKAVFLYNFVSFTEWPSDAFSTPDAPLVIGVLGTNPFGKFLEDATHDESIAGHHVALEYYKKVEEIKTCHVLFIGQSETNHLDHVLDQLKGRHVLTVSESGGTTQHEPVVRFAVENKKVRLKINLNEARAASLTLNAKLLQTADVVGGPKK